MALALVSSLAAAGPSTDDEILGAEEGWQIESIDLRAVYFDQQGEGYQSQAGPEGGPGSEEAWILEPWIDVVVRQSPRVRHEITIPIDVVTAASPNALDAVSTASLRNEGAGFDLRSTIAVSDADSVSTRVAFHWEEPLSSGTLGAGWRRSLADDNAAVSITGNLTVDGFGVNRPDGEYSGEDAREAVNANLAASQLLSPTTVIDGSYGVTWQHGTLAQTWNAVPVAGAAPVGELFPRDRLRHAIAGRIAQHIPPTRSTLKLWYRYYRDDFGLSAHTVEATVYQYLVPWLYLRGAYRFHRQSAVDFFTTGLDGPPMDRAPRTSDSDLDRFDASELGLGVVLLSEGGPRALRRISVVADYRRYERSNNLNIDVLTLGVGRRF